MLTFEFCQGMNSENTLVMGQLKWFRRVARSPHSDQQYIAQLTITELLNVLVVIASWSMRLIVYLPSNSAAESRHVTTVGNAIKHIFGQGF